ncbi:MAG: hypothetical protein LUE27_02020 [Clostridia bacterium]|nr:hypothetical protein [Clostridia bacterium]
MISSKEFKDSVKKMFSKATVEIQYPDAPVAVKPVEPEEVCGLQVSTNPETETLKLGTHTAASLCEYMDTLHDECMKEGCPAQPAPAKTVHTAQIIKPYKPVHYIPADEDEEDEEEDDWLEPYKDPAEKEWDLCEMDEDEKWVNNLFGMDED